MPTRWVFHWAFFTLKHILDYHFLSDAIFQKSRAPLQMILMHPMVTALFTSVWIPQGLTVTCSGMIPVMVAQTLQALVTVLEVQNTSRVLPILVVMLITNLLVFVSTLVPLTQHGFMDSTTVETDILSKVSWMLMMSTPSKNLELIKNIGFNSITNSRTELILLLVRMLIAWILKIFISITIQTNFSMLLKSQLLPLIVMSRALIIIWAKINVLELRILLVLMNTGSNILIPVPRQLQDKHQPLRL